MGETTWRGQLGKTEKGDAVITGNETSKAPDSWEWYDGSWLQCTWFIGTAKDKPEPRWPWQRGCSQLLLEAKDQHKKLHWNRACGGERCHQQHLIEPELYAGAGMRESHAIIYQDNKSAILLESNGKISSGKCTKHIKATYFLWSTRWLKGTSKSSTSPLHSCEQTWIQNWNKALHTGLIAAKWWTASWS